MDYLHTFRVFSLLSAFCSPHGTRVLWKVYTRYVMVILISCFIGEIRMRLTLDWHTSALRRREVVDYISSAFHWRDIRVLLFAYLPQHRHIWWRMVNSVCHGVISPLGRTLGYLEQRSVKQGCYDDAAADPNALCKRVWGLYFFYALVRRLGFIFFLNVNFSMKHLRWYILETGMRE